MTDAFPSLTDRMLAALPDDKARTILTAAFECFLQYGVRRTAMQDIADRAGMSRAALYLHYKNKDDIFHALMQGYYQAATSVVADTLAMHDDPVEALCAAFAAQVGDAAERMMDSPHAEELLSAKMVGAVEITRAGEARLAAAYAAWLRDGVARGRLSRDAVGPDPEVTAAVMLASVLGLKQAGLNGAGYAAARDRLAVMFGTGLRAG
jgi:AcrR family transcriptional regulator